jgi:hypothetical protein
LASWWVDTSTELNSTGRIHIRSSDSVHGRVNAFVVVTFAVAVTVFGLAYPSHAEIIYTRMFVEIINQGTHALDLNGDGVTDFTLALNLQQNGCVDSINAVETPASGNGAEGTPLVPLRKGAPIGPSQQFNGGAQTMASLTRTCPGYSYGGPWPGGGQTRYLGLSFLIDGETHYGWAQVQFLVITEGRQALGLELRLTGYAYETVPGMPINAGQTK